MMSNDANGVNDINDANGVNDIDDANVQMIQPAKQKQGPDKIKDLKTAGKTKTRAR